jgi:hypothetical protein
MWYPIIGILIMTYSALVYVLVSDCKAKWIPHTASASEFTLFGYIGVLGLIAQVTGGFG